MADSKAPIVESIVWGRMEVAGLDAGRDFKLYPGGGRPWDWRETNTHHVPGIQIADVQELLDHGSKIIVLSRGMELVLQTCPETLEFLASEGIEVHVEETRIAVKRFNQLARKGLPVGGLFHSTC